jgi:acetyltransferase-like isoleucine patch superfamily enzyme
MNRNQTFTPEQQALLELFEKLTSLKTHFDEQFLLELKRSLPFTELLFDRWDKAKTLGFGEGTSVYDSAHIFGNVQVGKHTWIGPMTILDGSGELSIGDHCSISASVHIYTHDTVQWAISGGLAPYEYAPTTIGNNCYIGPHSVIAKGITLGDGCIVGANSFVNQSFPKGSKIAGNPARLITT